MDDPFIRNYIEDLLKNIRTQVLLKLIKPYTRIRIPFISKVKLCKKFIYLLYFKKNMSCHFLLYMILLCLYSYICDDLFKCL